MNKLAMAALLLAGACTSAQAGGSASATMEMRFVIRAACSVQAGAASDAPQVACSQGVDYQLRRQPAVPAAQEQAQPSSASLAGDTWQVVF